MTINFFLNNGKRMKITSFDNVASNPFNVGDIIQLYVNELDSWTRHENKYSTALVDYKNLNETFHNKVVKLVEVEKYVMFDNFTNPELTIDYICEIVK